MALASGASDTSVVPAEDTGVPCEQVQTVDDSMLPAGDVQGDVLMVDVAADEDGHTTDMDVPTDDAMVVDDESEDEAVPQVDEQGMVLFFMINAHLLTYCL